MSKKIKLFLLVIISLILASVYFLFKGISLDSFSFGNIYISQLYIKYDKKLIVRVEEFKINTKSNTTSSMDDINQTLAKLPKILAYFQEIDIKHFEISGNEFSILFNKNNVYFDSKFLNLSAIPKFYGDTFELDLYSLYLKDIALFLDGKIKINTKTKSIDYFGNTIYKYANLNLNLNWSKDEISLFLNSKPLKDIKFLKDFFRLNKIAEKWMYENIKGKFELKDFFLTFNPKTFAPNISSIEGYLEVYDAQIKFNDNLEALKSPKINVRFKNDTLDFKIVEATYKDKELTNSKVLITNLSNEKKGLISISLNSNSLLDEDILNLLKTYKIDLPLKQLDGKTTSKLLLEIPYDSKRKIKTEGSFLIKNSNISLNGFGFFIKKAEVVLNNNQILVENSTLNYKNMINTNANFTIDLNKLSLDGNIYLKSFLLKNEKDILVHLKNQKSTIKASFKDEITIDLKDLNTKIEIKEDLTLISLDSIELLAKNSSLLKKMKITNGDLEISILSKDDIEFKTNLFNLNVPFLNKNKKPLKKISLEGELTSKYLEILSKDRSINLFIQKNKTPLLKLKSYDVLLFNLPKEEGDSSFKFDFVLDDINLFVKKDESYYLNKMNVFIDEKISFEGHVSKLELPILNKDKPFKEAFIEGTFEDNNLFINTIDKKIIFKLVNNSKLYLNFSDLNLVYDSEEKDEENSLDLINITGIRSSIIMNKTKTILSDYYTIKIVGDNIEVNLQHKKSKLSFTKDKDSNMNIKGEKLSDVLLNTFLNKILFEGGEVNVNASGKDNRLKGVTKFKDTNIKNMAALNNLILLVNTSPALLNPLLAIPTFLETVTQDGFNLDGYVVTKGKIDFDYNLKENVLDFSRIKIKGNTVDLEGFATLDLKNDLINSQMYLIFMKSYSLMVKYIPIINYVFLGDDKRVDTLVKLDGKLSDPTITTNLTAETASVPIDILKRILYLPIRAVEALIPDDKDKKQSTK